MKDNRHMIKAEWIDDILNEINIQKSIDYISDTFSRNEPETTLKILDAIKNDTHLGVSDENIDLVSNLVWKYYLVGYSVGRKTHSYKFEGEL